MIRFTKLSIVYHICKESHDFIFTSQSSYLKVGKNNLQFLHGEAILQYKLYSETLMVPSHACLPPQKMIYSCSPQSLLVLLLEAVGFVVSSVVCYSLFHFRPHTQDSAPN